MTGSPDLGTRVVERGLWFEGIVGGAASIAVAWPLTTLLRDNSWLDGALVLVFVIVITGGVLRSLGVGPSLTVMVQALAAIWVTCWRYAPETLWWGLPTWDTALEGRDLLQDAGRVLQTYAAPAPTTEGVEFLVVAMIGLTALSVDSIGVTGRSPATAGLPLAAAFLVSVSNNGEAMRPQFFVTVAVLWLVMIAQQGDRLVAGWSSADRREAIGSKDVSQGPTGHRRVARVLGVVTILGALVLASVLPHLPPTFLAEGLARNPDGRSLGGSASVSFTETMDLSQDLNSRSTEPVLRYRASSSIATPLRVTSTSEFDNGVWRPPAYDQFPAAQGLNSYRGNPQQFIAEGVPTERADITVLHNAMQAPHVALPYPLAEADLGVGWTVDAETDALRVSTAPSQYRATYLLVAPFGQVPPEALSDGADLPELYLGTDPASREAIAALSEAILGGAESDLDKAQRMQAHLRSPQYTYSLTLAPGLDQTDPITHFLQTRQGYCVQFATAMVMMARAEGIPARMAIGFLPGELQADGTRTVLASDAHSWPELYIDGLGWTRFEPTPGSRAGIAPSYVQQPDGPIEDEQTQDASPPVPVPTDPVDPLVPVEQETSFWDGIRQLAPGLLRGLVVVLVLGLAMLVVPWAGRRYREAGLRAAGTHREQIEGQWLLLVRSLDDLGVDPPQARSPRQMRKHYRDRATLDKRSGEALNRVTTTLEQSRYAAPAEGSDTAAQQVEVMGRDVRTVVETVRETLPWNIRTNIRVLPRSGVRYLRDRLSSLTSRG